MLKKGGCLLLARAENTRTNYKAPPKSQNSSAAAFTGNRRPKRGKRSTASLSSYLWRSFNSGKFGNIFTRAKGCDQISTRVEDDRKRTIRYLRLRSFNGGPVPAVNCQFLSRVEPAVLIGSADCHLLVPVGPCLCNDRVIKQKATIVYSFVVSSSSHAIHSTISPGRPLLNQTIPRSAARDWC